MLLEDDIKNAMVEALEQLDRIAEAFEKAAFALDRIAVTLVDKNEITVQVVNKDETPFG